MKFSSENPSFKVIKKTLLVVFLMVCGFALFLKSVTVVTEFAKTYTNQAVTISEETRIRNIVENYSNLSGCNIDDFDWIGFNGPSKTELVVHYHIELATRYTDIFTLTDSENPVRLYHSEGTDEVLRCSYDGVRYLFVYSLQGSGCFLGGKLFSWDETGPMTAAYRPEFLGGGAAKVVADQLFLSGDGKSFRLDKTNEGFELVEYTYDIDYADLGLAVHFLKAVRVSPDSLAITLDGHDVPFIQTQKTHHMAYSSRDTFVLGLNEEIMVLGGSVTFSPDDFLFRGGDMISSYVPVHKGNIWLSVTIPHRTYFHINFRIVNPFHYF